MWLWQWLPGQGIIKQSRNQAEEQQTCVLLPHNLLTIQEDLMSFLNPASLPQSPRNDITHTRLVSPTHHLMVIVSLSNPLAHNSLSLDARASHENVFIKLWFLLPALIQDTVLVSQGYKSDCVSSPGPFGRQLVRPGFAVSLIDGRRGSHLSHEGSWGSASTCKGFV